MRKGLLSSAVVLAILVTSLGGTSFAQGNKSAPGTQAISNANPGVLVEAVDNAGKNAAGAMVTIRSLTDGGAVVFQGMTDQAGQVHFASTLPAGAAATPGNVADAVYEAYIVGPGGDIQVKTFAVAHVKDMSKLSAREKQQYEQERVQHLKVQLKVDAATLEREMKKGADDVSTMTLGCTSLGYGGSVCVEAESTSSQNTKIGLVHVGNGEQVDFTLTSSAKVSIQAGIKTAEGGSWSSDTSISLSSDTSTAVDYSFSGTCIYSLGVGYCDLGRYLYAYYGYLYQNKAYYYNGAFARREWTVTPTGLVGSTSYYDWFYGSGDGKPVADVKNNVYGAKFEIFNGGSTSKSYTKERSFSFAASIPTAVGTFSAGLTTQYTNSHTIKWSTTSATHYFHYDYNTAGGDYYVTH